MVEGEEGACNEFIEPTQHPHQYPSTQTAINIIIATTIIIKAVVPSHQHYSRHYYS